MGCFTRCRFQTLPSCASSPLAIPRVYQLHCVTSHLTLKCQPGQMHHRLLQNSGCSDAALYLIFINSTLAMMIFSVWGSTTIPATFSQCRGGPPYLGKPPDTSEIHTMVYLSPQGLPSPEILPLPPSVVVILAFFSFCSLNRLTSLGFPA